MQTSGNCIRNVTADPRAGATAEEVDDPRVWAEVIRQWSTLHPEFSYLPRKFKIAVTASAADRTAARTHDIGLALKRGRDGQLGFEVMVGGGLGRTPYIGQTIREHLPVDRLLSYLQAILRVYNRHGRRDNSNKARIKILVAQLGVEEFARQVEAEWARTDPAGVDLPDTELARVRAQFATAFETLPATSVAFEAARAADPALARFARNNVHPHKQAGYAIVDVALEDAGRDARRLQAPTRWTPSPTWPSALAWAKSASPTNRIWCCPTSSWTMCRRSTRAWRRSAWPRPTST